MGEHTVTSFDDELNEIQLLILDMANSAKSMVDCTIRALLSRNSEGAKRVISEDMLMDMRQCELDDAAVRLIARRQPVAQDLRAVIGAIRMAGDLERIGDLAKNIAKRGGALQGNVLSGDLLSGINEMTSLVLLQITGVMEGYVSRDASGLGSLRSDDEKIDVLYTSAVGRLIDFMKAHPREIFVCTHLLFCLKNLERIGDHVTNIAENVYFIVTGERFSLSRPKYDPITPSGQEA